jgi:hypothetical protein
MLLSYLRFMTPLIQGTYWEMRVKTAGGCASLRPYDTIPWATPAHSKGPPESPCRLEKEDREQRVPFSHHCLLTLIQSDHS